MGRFKLNSDRLAKDAGSELKRSCCIRLRAAHTTTAGTILANQLVRRPRHRVHFARLIDDLRLRSRQVRRINVRIRLALAFRS